MWEGWASGDLAARQRAWQGTSQRGRAGGGVKVHHRWDRLPPRFSALVLDPGANVRVEDGLHSLRGKQLCSGQPTRVKDQPGESGAFSRTIIGDFVPKPDIGSITEIH